MASKVWDYKERLIKELISLGYHTQVAELAVIDLKQFYYDGMQQKLLPVEVAELMRPEIERVYAHRIEKLAGGVA